MGTQSNGMLRSNSAIDIAQGASNGNARRRSSSTLLASRLANGSTQSLRKLYNVPWKQSLFTSLMNKLQRNLWPIFNPLMLTFYQLLSEKCVGHCNFGCFSNTFSGMLKTRRYQLHLRLILMVIGSSCFSALVFLCGPCMKVFVGNVSSATCHFS